MPLIVYLDTQDYLNLHYEASGGPYHQTLDKLLSFRDRGEIVIGFSFATIVEVVTKPDAKNRAERVRRGQLIKDVCGPHAFPYLSHMAKGAKFPNDGTWLFPAGHRVVSAAQFRGQMRKELRHQLKNVDGFNRAQKRYLKSKAGLPDLIRATGSTWGRKRADYGGIPVSNEVIESRIFDRFIRGECSNAEFEKVMNAWLSDPAEYSRIFYDYADYPSVVEEHFQGGTKQLEAIFAKLSEVASQIRAYNARASQVRKNLLAAGIDKRRAKDATTSVQLPTQFDGIEERLEPYVGMGRAGHFELYLKSAMQEHTRFKSSDMFDLLQFCYAYECDLFRCDKAMSALFRDHPPFQGKLVERFHQIPERIEQKLS